MHLSQQAIRSIMWSVGMGAGVLIINEVIAHFWPYPHKWRGRGYGYILTITAVSVAAAVGILHPPVDTILSVILIAAYLLSIFGRGGPPRRRVGSGATRLKVKQFLARGVPARRPASA